MRDHILKESREKQSRAPEVSLWFLHMYMHIYAPTHMQAQTHMHIHTHTEGGRERDFKMLKKKLFGPNKFISN